MVEGETAILKAEGKLTGARFWEPANPYLYDVYSILKVDGKVVDVNKIRTGFRKTAFKGGAGTGGVYINDRFVYLKGYAQRSINEWAAVGGAYPDWMHDFTAEMLRNGNGNYMRWMHIAPKAQDVRACDRFGIVQICPGGRQGKRRRRPSMGTAHGSYARYDDLLSQQSQHLVLGSRQQRRQRRPHETNGRVAQRA